MGSNFRIKEVQWGIGSYGASNTTLVWLGAMRAPGQFVEFCSATLVSRVAGIPVSNTVKAAVKWRSGPMTELAHWGATA